MMCTSSYQGWPSHPRPSLWVWRTLRCWQSSRPPCTTYTTPSRHTAGPSTFSCTGQLAAASSCPVSGMQGHRVPVYMSIYGLVVKKCFHKSYSMYKCTKTQHTRCSIHHELRPTGVMVFWLAVVMDYEWQVLQLSIDICCCWLTSVVVADWQVLCLLILWLLLDRCCSCCCCCCCVYTRHEYTHVVDDNCCSCHLAAIRKLSGLDTRNIVYANCHVEVLRLSRW